MSDTRIDALEQQLARIERLLYWRGADIAMIHEIRRWIQRRDFTFPTPDLAAQLAEARAECEDLRHQVAGKTALIDDMQEAMAERGRLVAEKFMSEQRTAEAIAAYCDDVFGVDVGADIRAGRWRVADKLAAKEGE